MYEIAVVAQPDKSWWVQKVIIEQAEDYRTDQRAGNKAEEQKQGRTYKEVGGQGVTAFAGRAARPAGPRRRPRA